MLIDLKAIKLPKEDFQKFANLFKRKHVYKSPTYIFASIGFLFGLITCAISLWNIFLPEYKSLSVYGAAGYKLLFDFFAFFTQQSNIIVIITYFLFLTMFKTRIFNNRNLVVATGIYINLTMFTYWTVMMPQWVMHTLGTYVWWSIFSNISFHLFCPIIYDLFLLFNVNYPYRKCKNPLNRLHTPSFIPTLFIYPFLYMIFAIIINFVKLPPEAFRTDIQNLNGEFIWDDLVNNHPYASIYNAITCFNSKCWITHIGLGDYPNIACFDDTSGGSILFVLIAFPVGLIFMFNVVWIMSVNNHFTTPKSMMQAVIKQWKLNEINNSNIFAGYLHAFRKELETIHSTGRKNAKK